MMQLIEMLFGIERRIEQMERRMNNVIREGPITRVDPQTGLASMDAQGVESPPRPWMQVAGGIREWSPPKPGQHAILLSPGGDPERGLILPGSYTDDYDQPHDDGDAFRRTVGDVSITHSGGALVISAGGVTTTFSAAGLTIQGGHVKHDGRSIGSDHRHGGVIRGGAETEHPSN